MLWVFSASLSEWGELEGALLCSWMTVRFWMSWSCSSKVRQAAGQGENEFQWWELGRVGKEGGGCLLGDNLIQGVMLDNLCNSVFWQRLQVRCREPQLPRSKSHWSLTGKLRQGARM